jgi:hypothetical protein
MNHLVKPMEDITITRALAELKLLDKRIVKKIETAEFVTLKSRRNAQQLNPELFANNSKAEFQSIQDLINRRNKIKNAIILSNATTKVKIGDNIMSVAEVIERKQSLGYYKSLFEKLKVNRESVKSHVERNNQQVEADLQKILELNFGKSSTGKTNSDDIENISKAYRDSNKTEMLDPINIDQKIKDIEKIIDEFDRESNFVLSEANAMTKISV